MIGKKGSADKITNLRIGWVVPRVLPYYRVMASTRLRAYDVIKYLRRRNVTAGLYNPLFKYDIVVFQKAFNNRFLSLAKKLKEKQTKIVFDINVNYIDRDDVFVTDEQQLNIKDMLKLADSVITPSQYLRELYLRYNKKTYLIEEAIEERFFSFKKEHTDKDVVNILFCGYAIKSRELYVIKNILKYLYEDNKIHLILICEKDPQLDIIPYKFYKYNHRKLPNLLMNGDLKASPRDLSRRYNLGHTFTRIGYPMSIGLPVVASPLDAYKGSPAKLCNNNKEWRDALENLICSYKLRKELAEAGRAYVRREFSEHRIIEKYKNLFARVITEY